MRSSDNGVNWSEYVPTGITNLGELRSINSIGGRLVLGGVNRQFQIFNNVVTEYNTPSPLNRVICWESIVKDANSNGFDMAGFTRPPAIGAYSNF